jgi:hypothetical protein
MSVSRFAKDNDQLSSHVDCPSGEAKALNAIFDAVWGHLGVGHIVACDVISSARSSLRAHPREIRSREESGLGSAHRMGAGQQVAGDFGRRRSPDRHWERAPSVPPRGTEVTSPAAARGCGTARWNASAWGGTRCCRSSRRSVQGSLRFSVSRLRVGVERADQRVTLACFPGVGAWPVSGQRHAATEAEGREPGPPANCRVHPALTGPASLSAM